MLKKEIVYIVTLLFVLLFQSCDTLSESRKMNDEGQKAAFETFNAFLQMFLSCIALPMPDQHLRTDDLKAFVNYPSKTTVGVAQKFTNNRKFFANMITTTGFKEMLARDEEEIRRDIIKKLEYCDEVIMDQNVLKEFYDREVDQTKI